MANDIEVIPVTFAGLKGRGTVPRWVKGFDVARSTVDELNRAYSLPELCVLQSPRPHQIYCEQERLTELLNRCVQGPEPVSGGPASGSTPDSLCRACFTGDYPVGTPETHLDTDVPAALRLPLTPVVASR